MGRRTENKQRGVPTAARIADAEKQLAVLQAQVDEAAAKHSRLQARFAMLAGDLSDDSDSEEERCNSLGHQPQKQLVAPGLRDKRYVLQDVVADPEVCTGGVALLFLGCMPPHDCQP
jgi:hypothetical protein